MVSPLSVNERLIAHVAIPMKRIPSNSICSTMSHEEMRKTTSFDQLHIKRQAVERVHK